MSDEYLDENIIPVAPRYRFRDLILGDYALSTEDDRRWDNSI